MLHCYNSHKGVCPFKMATWLTHLVAVACLKNGTLGAGGCWLLFVLDSDYIPRMASLEKLLAGLSCFSYLSFFLGPLSD